MRLHSVLWARCLSFISLFFRVSVGCFFCLPLMMCKQSVNKQLRVAFDPELSLVILKGNTALFISPVVGRKDADRAAEQPLTAWQTPAFLEKASSPSRHTCETHSHLTFYVILSQGHLHRTFTILLMKLFAYKLLHSFKTSSDFSIIVQSGIFDKVRKPH